MEAKLFHNYIAQPLQTQVLSLEAVFLPSSSVKETYNIALIYKIYTWIFYLMCNVMIGLDKSLMRKQDLPGTIESGY